MVLYFKSLELHNFGSYASAKFDLTNHGFCAVTGKNLCKKDNSTSNGSGKCFGKGTEILMFDGTIKPIEQLQVGDLVMGSDSTPRTVLELHSGVDNLYRVSGTKTNNYNYICNGKHELNLFQTCGRDFKSIPNEIQISVEDYLANNIPAEAKHTFKRYYNQMTTTGVDFQNVSQLLLDPYIFGLWLGDGYSEESAICSADKEIVSALYEFAADNNLDISIHAKHTADGTLEKCKVYRFKKSSHGRSTGRSNMFTAALKQLNVFGYKHIPLSYLTASKSDRLALLAGIIDTDGALCKRTGRNNSSSYYFEIAQKSKKLATEIIQLARFLGFRATITEKICRPYVNGILGRQDTYYRICINGNLWEIPTKVLRKRCPAFKPQHTNTLVPKITDVGVGTYYGFTCDVDHKFLLGDGTIVHNSTPWSAICYAITGETISGLTNNLKNINVDENECWVKLDLVADNNSFELTRIHRPKSDLKIIKNGVDISGKSIRESEKVLAEHLPDLTKDLIASTIIVGQGMPNKFSSFSPSGRKELLEKLTKSDFMIEDLKERLISRQAKLQQQLQEYISSNLVNKTNLDNAEATLLATDRELSEPIVDFDSEISTYQNAVEKAKINYKAAQASLASFESNFDKLNNDLLAITTSKASESTALQAEYSKQKNKLDLDQYKYNVDIKQLQAEVAKLKQITDICPTCGQKLPNISKPDTSLQEQQIQVLTEKANLLLAESTKITDKYKNDLKELDNKFEEALSKKQEEVRNIKLKINEVKQVLSNLNDEIVANTTKLNQALFNKENCNKRRSFLQAQKQELELKINTLKNAISITTNAKLDLDEHIAVVKKMDTLVKRDFRGYLLTDIINYIDAKAKEYCKIVFNTDELNIYLDGNALDISYAGKMFDSLSGGEKQRCDLILQFAIRDLLQTYLGYSSNILVLDEIFDNLDKQATTKIIDLITEKLKDIESIFIISHHADELAIPIDSELLIVKNEFGISEVSAA